MTLDKTEIPDCPSFSVGYLIGAYPAATEHAILEEISSVEACGIRPLLIASRFSGDPLPEEFPQFHGRVRALDAGSAAGFLAKLRSAAAGLAALVKSPRGLACRPFETGLPLGRSAIWRRPRLWAYLKGSGAQILHAEFGHLGLLALPVARRLGIPLVVSFRGQDVLLMAQARRAWREALAREADLVLARSQNMRDDLMKMGFPAGKVVVHPSPIRVRDIAFQERVSPRADEPVVILMAGRMVPKKGMRDGLRAFAACRPGPHGAQLRIAGDGPERTALERQARDLGVADRVTFLGALPRSKLLSEMMSAHLFMLPCRTAPDGEKEGIPNVLKEAQATGLPVLSTTHAGIPEGVASGESGYLAPEGDVPALTECLGNLLSHPEAWRDMGRRGRALVEERFDSARLAILLRGYYDTLLRTRRGPTAVRPAAPHRAV